MANVFSDRDLGEDRINELPDDILLRIMSPLQMDEAAKTSIISKRWRYLWAKRTHLDFNHVVLFPETDPDPFDYATTEHKTKYLNWVNQVVDLHCFPCIDTFKVRFQFERNVTQHIDKWVRFAISKKVKHLDLQLFDYACIGISHTIGFDVLQPSTSPGYGDFSFLISFHLHHINISGDVLEFLLTRCRVLERLHVVASRTLERLKVSGPSCKLKQLILSYCSNLAELEIDAANLVSFFCYGPKWGTNLVFKSIPMLVDVAVGGFTIESIFPLDLAGQLSKLSLILPGGKSPLPRGFHPTLSSLNQLTLILEVFEPPDLDAIMTLLESCKTVRKLKVELAWHYLYDVVASYELQDDNVEGDDLEGDDLEGDDVEVDNVLDWEDTLVPLQRNTHPNLKVLHVAGFIGCHTDVLFILSFVDFACNLETIICDSTPSIYGTSDKVCVEASRSRASKLAKIVPPKICVEII